MLIGIGRYDFHLRVLLYMDSEFFLDLSEVVAILCRSGAMSNGSSFGTGALGVTVEPRVMKAVFLASLPKSHGSR